MVTLLLLLLLFLCCLFVELVSRKKKERKKRYIVFWCFCVAGVENSFGLDSRSRYEDFFSPLWVLREEEEGSK